MKQIYDKISDIALLYLAINIVILTIRAFPVLGPNTSMDCEKRFVDKYFLLARLHCPIDEDKKVEIFTKQIFKTQEIDKRPKAALKYFPKDEK